MRKKERAIILALLAAVFYAISTPISKLLMEFVPSTMMAGFLYLGAGVGVGAMYAFRFRKEPASERLGREDAWYTAGMIALDIAAPIFLMIGIKSSSASGAALLENFEIVATTLIALIIFKEVVTKRLWIAIALITAASFILTLDGTEGVHFSLGSLFVLLATVCWGLENNCTRNISSKSTYEIVLLKGIFSGLGALIIALIVGEHFPAARYIFAVMLLGFIAYGLSIFVYIRAQRELGAAKTSAYYAVAPFVGAALSFALLGERPSVAYLIGLLFMIAGTAVVVADTIIRSHAHEHVHTFTHEHDGSVHTHTVTHVHAHNHYGVHDKHGHHHSDSELEQELNK